MDNTGIKAIVFDLGNVLIDFDHYIAARRMSCFTNRDPKEIFDLFFDSELTGLFEEGKISPTDFFLKLKQALSFNDLSYEEFLPIWNEIFFLTDKNRQVYRLAKELKNYYKIALLSNINVLHFDYLKNKFTIFSPFETIITSFEVGVRKPHPLIYEKTLERLGITQPNCVFYTDDRPELVREAQRLGINSFTFQDVYQLEKDLRQLGIDIT
ncbi:MAG: HAD family phosphatase [Candidatus Omnitrophica bacterium]|nr:HAD family phosphatase [Candidatus Omnitrophota bacterium]